MTQQAKGKQHAVDVDTPLIRTRSAAASVDPYLEWAAARQFSGHAAQLVQPREGPAWRHLSCVVELRLAALQAAAQKERTQWWKLLWRDHKLHVTPAYRKPLVASQLGVDSFVYVTAVARTSHVVALQQAAYVRRVVLSLPRGGGQEQFNFSDYESKSTQRKASKSKAGQLAKSVVAVIDDGFPFLHPQFNNRAGVSRLQWFWDQDVGVREPGTKVDDPSARPWRSPAGFEYGRELAGQRLSVLKRALTEAGRPVDADSLYAGLCYPAAPGPGRSARADRPSGAWAMPQSLHGSLCASLAAGLGEPPLQSTSDAAADADLIFVQLPSETVADTSGGGLATYVLDALRYVLDRSNPDAPLVVNLSYGAAAGPHNGTSILECALEQLLAERTDFALVVPAGNLYSDPIDRFADERRLHAALTVEPGSTSTLVWEIPAGSQTEHFLELWPQGDAALVSGLHVSLHPPQGAGSLLHVRQDQTVFSPPAPATGVACGVVHCSASPLGLQGAVGAPMALLAVAPVAAAAQGLVPYGRWRVEAHNAGLHAIDLHAWIERADATFGGRSRQSYFPADECATSPKHSLTTVAHGPNVLVVGGLVGPLAAACPAMYTASGPALAPSSRLGPDFSAVCEADETQAFLMVSGCHPGTWVRANGTSIAAPRVARQVVNLLTSRSSPRNQSAADLKKWLLRKAKGKADERQGKVLPG
jgi:hypothetical protein